jgi:nucleotide sugar dehydrogenase
LLESKSELFEGDDFHVIFSPERVLTGRVFQDLRRYPKLVGATNSKGFKLGKTFYDSVIQFDERSDLKFQNGVWDLGSLEAAEFAKLAETTYRDVNIALANQFAQFADTVGADIGRVIEACNSQPFSNIHKPGISVGGHCIPVYPRLYLHNDKDAHLVETARLKNLEMPGWVADKVNDAVRPLAEKKILILGATYRGGVKETAYSGVFALRDSLKQYCANVFVSDPMLTAEELTTRGLRTDFTNDQIDVIILHTDHEEYKNLTSDHFPNCFWIFDGRGTLNPSQFPNSVYWSIMGRDFDNIH